MISSINEKTKRNLQILVKTYRVFELEGDKDKDRAREIELQHQ